MYIHEKYNSVVAATTISPNFLILGPPLLFFFLQTRLGVFYYFQSFPEFRKFSLKTWSFYFSVSNDQSTILSISEAQWTSLSTLRKQSHLAGRVVYRKPLETFVDASKLVCFTSQTLFAEVPAPQCYTYPMNRVFFHLSVSDIRLIFSYCRVD